MLLRQVEPEWLDELPPDDPEAVESRQDLRRVNAWMGHAGIHTRLLDSVFHKLPPRVIVDLGAGDGSMMLRLARRFAPHWKNVTVILVDRAPVVHPDLYGEFVALGWELETVTADVLEWLLRRPVETADLMLANLFLHHFPPDRLKRLLKEAAERTKVFFACEPRRSRVSWAGSHLLWLIGCNAVSQHDAVVSVRAGFTGQELSQSWPVGSRWTLHEGPVGLFSHYFLARRAT